MDATTFDAAVNVAKALFELAATTGLTAGVVAYLKANNISLQALQNNKLVAAAERVAMTAITDVVVKGLSPTDPAVISDVIAQVKASITATHAETAVAVGAQDNDLTRIAKNAVSAAVATVVTPAAPTPIGSTSDPVQAVQDAASLLDKVKQVALSTSPTVPYIPPAAPVSQPTSVQQPAPGAP